MCTLLLPVDARDLERLEVQGNWKGTMLPVQPRVLAGHCPHREVVPIRLRAVASHYSRCRIEVCLSYLPKPHPYDWCLMGSASRCGTNNIDMQRSKILDDSGTELVAFAIAIFDLTSLPPADDETGKRIRDDVSAHSAQSLVASNYPWKVSKSFEYAAGFPMAHLR